MMQNLPEPKLMHALEFTPADLDANRAGQITAQQRARVQAARQEENSDLSFALLFLGVPGLFGCAICAFLFNIPTIITAVAWLPQIIGVGLVLLVMAVAYSAWQGRANMRAGQRGEVRAVMGDLYVEGDETRARPRFYLIVGEERFRIPWRVYEPLVTYANRGLPHRLYYVPGVRFVLSVESLPPK